MGKLTIRMKKKNSSICLVPKKWNPYCIRHSAITSDSDFLPEYALKKKVIRRIGTRPLDVICQCYESPYDKG